MQKRVLKQAPLFPASVVRALEEYALTCRSESASILPSPISPCFAFMPAAALEMPPKSKRFSFQGTRTFSWQKLRPQMQRKLTRWNVLGCFCRSRQLVGDFTQIPGVSFGRCKWAPWNMKPGQFLDRRLTTSEANLWLKEVLVRAGLATLQAPQYSTHSCKAAVATWAGKFGGFSMDERRMLTHHMDANSRGNLTAFHSSFQNADCHAQF